MRPTARPLVPVALLCAALASACASTDTTASEPALQIEYLEIVTPDVDATCSLLTAVHGVPFGDPVPEFGNARTATLSGGGRIGVRAPMRDTEAPVVRPYILVDDAEAAAAAAQAAGGEIAMPTMEIPEQGLFAIYLHGGIDHGLWQRPTEDTSATP